MDLSFLQLVNSSKNDSNIPSDKYSNKNLKILSFYELTNSIFSNKTDLNNCFNEINNSKFSDLTKKTIFIHQAANINPAELDAFFKYYPKLIFLKKEIHDYKFQIQDAKFNN